MTPDEILMQLASMWRIDITWKDADCKAHITTAYTSFEITDDVAEKILEAQELAWGCPIDPITQEITEPVAIE
jgi:hypothetical protein